MKQTTKIKAFKVMVAVWLLFGVWCLIVEANSPSQPPQPTPNIADKPSEWVDNYAPVIGLIKPAIAGDLFDKYFGTEANLARAIAQSESGLNEKAISKPNKNKTIDYGIMQINSCHADKVNGNLDSLLDAETNIRVGKQIRDDSGWTAWTVYKTKAYLKYLK